MCLTRLRRLESKQEIIRPVSIPAEGPARAVEAGHCRSWMPAQVNLFFREVSRGCSWPGCVSQLAQAGLRFVWQLQGWVLPCLHSRRSGPGSEGSSCEGGAAGPAQHRVSAGVWGSRALLPPPVPRAFQGISPLSLSQQRKQHDQQTPLLHKGRFLSYL